MFAEIGGIPCEYRAGIREDAALRGSFNALAETTFGLNFENWYQGGFWGDDYEPHVLLAEGRVAANVSVNRIPLRIGNERRLYIQLGTVMTAPAFRGRGFARFLLTRVLEEWKGRCGAVYLFANDSALGFYPRFGFAPEREYEHRLPLPGGCAPAARRLDMESGEDRAALLAAYARGNPFSALEMERNPGLLMFYCAQFLKNAVWAVPEADAVVIAEPEADGLLCYDVFGSPAAGSSPAAGLGALLSAAAHGASAASGVRTARLGFTPAVCPPGTRAALRWEEDTTLFVLRGGENPFAGQKRMFPLLSHA